MTRVLLIPVEGKPQEVQLRADPEKGTHLRHLQELIGGLVDVLHLEGIDFWFADEGLILEMPPNAFIGGHLIHGPIVLARHDGHGGMADLTDADVRRWSRLLG